MRDGGRQLLEKTTLHLYQDHVFISRILIVAVFFG